MAVRPAQKSVYVPHTARSFDPGSSQKLYLNSSWPFGSVPFSMAAWFKPARATAHEAILSIQHYGGGSGGDNHALKVRGDLVGDPVAAHSYETAGTPRWAESTTGITVGKWHHALGVWAAEDDRRVYLDGGSKGTDANSLACPGINSICVAATYRSGGDSRYYSGGVAEAAFWNCVLNDQDAWDLSRGKNPQEIRPDALQLYLSLDAKEGELNFGIVSCTLARWFGFTVISGPPRARTLRQAPKISFLPLGPLSTHSGKITLFGVVLGNGVVNYTYDGISFDEDGNLRASDTIYEGI